MSLTERLIKNSRSKLTTTLSKSKLFNEKSYSRTKVPILNIALSGSVRGGLQSGMTILAGPSKHFKSNLGLTLVAAYLNDHKDAVCLFYDSEFGITTEYMKSFGIDPNRVIHVPVANVEELKTDMSRQLDVIERGEKVIIFIDSIGNTGSKKEADDAIEKGASTVDFTRAKELKSTFRICTPYFTLKDIPCVAINHTIETIAMFSQTVMTGGTGLMYSSDNVIFIGRRQIKEGTEITGYNFVLNTEKSRMVKEKSKFFLEVTFDGGIDRFSGLLEIGLELGYIIKPKNGWYQPAFLNEETGEIAPLEDAKSYREKQTKSSDKASMEFWSQLLKHEPFLQAIEQRYRLSEMVSQDDIDDEIESMLN